MKLLPFNHNQLIVISHIESIKMIISPKTVYQMVDTTNASMAVIEIVTSHNTYYKEYKATEAALIEFNGIMSHIQEA
jgi:hypothetical protein